MKTPILLSIITGLTAFPLVAQQDDSSQGSNEDQSGRRKGPPPTRLVLTLDADHDKVISAAEIAGAAKALGKLDKNGDNELTSDEFARPKPTRDKDAQQRDDEGDKPSDRRPPPPDRLAGAIDADHDKVISAAEIKAAPESLSTLDKNKDGQLTREEFAPKPGRKPHGSKDTSGSEDQQSDDEGEGQGGPGQPGGNGGGGAPQDDQGDPRPPRR